MKKTILLLGALCASVTCVVVTAFSDPPTFVTKNASGTTSAEVIFPADPVSQARIVNCIGTSDKAASVFSFTSGGGAYVISSAGVAGTTITVSQTNGLLANDVLVISSAGTNYARTISSFSSSTNIVLTATTGNATAVGDSVYKMTSATTVKCGAATTVYSGEAIFVGARGRPIRLVLDGTSACSLDSISARYE